MKEKEEKNLPENQIEYEGMIFEKRIEANNEEGYALIGPVDKYNSETHIPSTINGLPVLRITKKAFNWALLRYLFIPKTVKYFERGAFYRASPTLLNIFCEAEEQPAGFENDWDLSFIMVATFKLRVYWGIKNLFKNDYFFYTKEGNSNNQTVKIFKYIGSEDDITIPEFIDDIPVKEIGQGAFYKTKIKSVHFSRNIIKLGHVAFDECPNLKSVFIPRNILFMEQYVFRNTTIFCEREKPALGWDEFWNDDGCKTIFGYRTDCKSGVYNGMTYYESYFEDSTKIISIYGYTKDLKENIIIPKTINGLKVRIINYAFKDACNLKTVIIEDSSIQIEKEAFCGCYNCER